jgi:predicted ATPase
MLGKTIQHYRIDAALGEGGMGLVYRGYDTKLDRPVAIKVLLKPSVDAAEAVERFLREARAASALNHPNIVTIHEIGAIDEGHYFMVQELVDGRTLRSLVGEPMDVGTAAGIASQIARALAVAHASGIVHRDIKPENVMVRADGYVKVLDFGLARIVPDASAMTISDYTRPGMVFGTASYMSPEQARGEPAGPAADLFALGIILFEMLTGRRPFTGDSTLAVLHGIVSEHPAPLARLRPALPSSLDALVLRLLAKNPAQRPTAQETATELESLGRAEASISAPLPRATTIGQRHTVGRRKERAELRRAFQEVVAGRSLMLSVSGEPGIGKTSVAEDFLAWVVTTDEHPVVARGKCSERLAGTEAYLPLLEALDNLLHSGTGGSFSEVTKVVAPTWFVQVAALPDSLTAQEIRADAKAASQERMKRELGSLFQEVSRIRPLVVFFEDLHWADASTVDILNYLAGRFESMRVLILVTYRPSEMFLERHSFLQVRDDLQSRGLLQELPLDFLTRAEIEHYLGLEFPGHEFPEAFVHVLHTKTEGNPLFMVDLVRYLRDRGFLAQKEQRWQLARSLPELERELPESVRSTIARKLERLDETDRKLLLAGAVQGHSFDSTVVSEATGVDAADVEERLEGLAQVHALVRSEGSEEFPDLRLTVKYRFVHVLYQNVLYGSLQPTRRSTLSAKVAESLVAHYGDRAAEQASELAHLYEAARDFRKAAHYFQLAAAQGARLFAFREAVALAQRGLAQVRALPEGAERNKAELGLQMILGRSLRSVAGWAAPEVETIYTRARQLCQQLGDVPELFPVLWSLSLFHAIRGDLRANRELARQLLAQAEASGNPVFLVAAHQTMGSVLEFLGETKAAGEHLERAVSLHNPEQQLDRIFGLDSGMIARSQSVLPLWLQGQPDTAVRRMDDTMRLARAMRQPITLVFALLLSENLHVLRREPQQAIKLGDELIALCREYGLAQELEWGRCFQASAMAQVGHGEAAVEQLRDSLARQHALGAGLLRSTFRAHLAYACLVAGRTAEGLAAVAEALELSEQTLERYYVAELLRIRGDLLLQQGDPVNAEASFRDALAFAERQGVLAFELRAATGLARTLAVRGALAEARQSLAPVVARFSEGRDSADLLDAQHQLEHLASRPSV